MTDNEKKRLSQLIFTEIRADHVEGRVSLEFVVRPAWEPYVEAVLVRRRMTEPGLPAAVTPERKTGLVRINPPFNLTLLGDETIELRRAA